MNCTIARLVVFGFNYDKRQINFYPGLNIITGDSKTGKSAILEIVDYCLFAGRSTIPKGVIEDFASLYVLVLRVRGFYLIIGRRSAKFGDAGRAYVRAEPSDDFLNNFNSSYFDKYPSRPLKEAQAEVESYLGLSVLDTRYDEDSDPRKHGKASIRSAVPFLLQHQNLIANKHSIFYRFDDFYKRKKTVEDFPVLIGWESGQYYMLLRELEGLKREHRQKLALRDKQRKGADELALKVRSHISRYYSFIGQRLDPETSYPELIKLLAQLPDFSFNADSGTEVARTLRIKEREHHELLKELAEAADAISILEDNSNLGGDQLGSLGLLKATSGLGMGKVTGVCPLCDSPSSILNERIEGVISSRGALFAELQGISSYIQDSSDQLGEFRKKRSLIKRRLTSIAADIDALRRESSELNSKASIRDSALILKGKAIGAVQELLVSVEATGVEEELKRIASEIGSIERELKRFNVDGSIENAEKFLSDTMTKICGRLDFEEELKPGVLKFSLQNFSFWYEHNGEKIYLSEMGSGANWLACHLSIFLSFLYLNCLEKKSAIPTFLIIDQPSQVYFPNKYGELDEEDAGSRDENIRQVRNIFKVIVEVVDEIREACGHAPQVIVMEHADEPDFDKFVRRRWEKNGEKLI